MSVVKKGKIGTTVYTKFVIILLVFLFVFVTIRGVLSNLNQEKLKLEKEVHSLASSNEWIKYEINDKISLDNLEKYAARAGMTEAVKEQIEVVIFNKNKIIPSSALAIKKEKSVFNFSFNNIKKAIGEFFNGKQ